MITYSTMTDTSASTIQTHTKSWTEVCKILRSPITNSSKAACPLIKLAKFGDKRSNGGSLRNDANVIEIHGVELDYDGGETMMAEAAEMLQKAGIEAALYTSASHKPDKPRWRVLAPLSKPVTPEQRAPLVARLNGVLGGIAAGESFTLSQSYYFGKVKNVPYDFTQTTGTTIDQLPELDAGAMGPKQKPKKSDDTSHASNGDWLEELLSGDDVHVNALRLVGKLVKQGMTRDAIKPVMIGLSYGVEEQRGAVRAAELRGAELERMIEGAFQKGYAEKSKLNKTRHTRHTQPSTGGKSSQGNIDPSRMGQNEMASAVTHGLRNTLGYDAKSRGWFGRDKDIWQPKTETLARTTAELAIEKLKPGFTAGYLSGVLKFLESRLSLPDWESDRNLLPMRNGVLNLATGELSDYGSRVFNWQVPHDHDAAATCPTITRWLHTVTNGDNDLKAFLLAWMRVVLTGGAHLQKYLEIVGPGGTGKSTFIRLCQLLVGNANSVTTDLKTLEASRFESAGLYGKRLAIVSDSARYGGEVATLKAITGGDPLRFEQKNIQAGESFVFAGVVMIAANEPIQSADYTSGLARRRIPIFFNQKVSEADKLAIPDFETRLAAEIPGLLNTLLGVNPKQADHTIRNPGASIASSKLAAELETNPLLAWMHERLIQCQKGQETAIGTLKTNGLYADYANYCDEHRREPVSTTRFSGLVFDNATSRGIDSEKTRVPGSGERVLKNLRLRQASDMATPLLFVTGTNSPVTTSGLESAECDDCEGFLTTSGFHAGVEEMESGL